MAILVERELLTPSGKRGAGAFYMGTSYHEREDLLPCAIAIPPLPNANIIPEKTIRGYFSVFSERVEEFNANAVLFPKVKSMNLFSDLLKRITIDATKLRTSNTLQIVSNGSNTSSGSLFRNDVKRGLSGFKSSNPVETK